MHPFTGVISVVQEGRFRLDTDEGRSLHFTLDRNAPIEPQDLIHFRERRVWVFADGPVGMGGHLARDIRQVPA